MFFTSRILYFALVWVAVLSTKGFSTRFDMQRRTIPDLNLPASEVEDPRFNNHLGASNIASTPHQSTMNQVRDSQPIQGEKSNVLVKKKRMS